MRHSDQDAERMRDIAPVGLRLPAELKALVKEAAANNDRSINAEIVVRLRASFDAENRIDRLSRQVEELLERFDDLRILNDMNTPPEVVEAIHDKYSK